jgi:hypothetical protein
MFKTRAQMQVEVVKSAHSRYFQRSKSKDEHSDGTFN